MYNEIRFTLLYPDCASEQIKKYQELAFHQNVKVIKLSGILK
jgi:hypothetical protein